jgi:hypothetical protein
VISDLTDGNGARLAPEHPRSCGANGSIFSGKYDQFHTIRENIERKYMETIDLVPGLAERVLAGRQGDRLYAR